MTDGLAINELAQGLPAPDATDQWLARVNVAGPIIEAKAGEADRDRRLTKAAMAAIHEQSLLRLLLPRDVGGIETPLPVFFSVIEAIARYDGSAAWCVCQGNACAMLAAYLDHSFAASIWADDPSAVLAWGPTKAEALAVEGGYSVTANTSFSSGSHHATWLGAHCPVVGTDGKPRLDAAGVQENRTVLIPADQVELDDAWEAMGLRGTGSDGFVARDLFVPASHTIVRAPMIENCPVRSTLHGLPLMSVYASGFAAVALGIARAYLDRFIALAQAKKPRGLAIALNEDPVVQDEVARAEARISASRAFLVDAIAGGWYDLVTTDRMSVHQRMRIRLAGTHAIHEAKSALDMLYDSAGSSAVLASSPFERRFRDIHTVALQIQARKRHYQTYGSWMLGHDVNAGNMTVI